MYREAAEQYGTVHPVSYSRFTFLWRKLVPFIVIMMPRSDLCWQCYQKSTAIIHTANQPESEKTAAIAKRTPSHCQDGKGVLQVHLQQNARKVSKPTSKAMTNLLCPFQILAFPAIPMTSKCTIHSTMHTVSKCTFPLIRYSLGQSIF